jgi:hypothetical protein
LHLVDGVEELINIATKVLPNFGILILMIELLVDLFKLAIDKAYHGGVPTDAPDRSSSEKPQRSSRCAQKFERCST